MNTDTLDIRPALKHLARAQLALLGASFEGTATRDDTLAHAQECAQRAEAAIAQLRVDSEQGQEIGPENDNSDDMT